MKYLNFLILLTISFFTTCCTSPHEQASANFMKVSASDSLKNGMTESQFFEIEGKKDQVTEAKQGTLFFFPKGCFVTASGKPVEGNIKVEIVEALTVEDMILSNLTTTSNGKLLETGGMLYINATSNGEPLKINSEKPVYIEVPVEKRKPGMMAYQGTRDEKGNMNWINPKPLQNYLVPVDISLLDFYPQGFEAEVAAGLPFRKHIELSKQLTDSLYYSLSAYQNGDITKGFLPTDYNEPYYNKLKKVVNGKYTSQSYEIKDRDSSKAHSETFHHDDHQDGIDPAMIKVLWSSKFNNTYIATREFEKRLHAIFKTCDKRILEIYVGMLDKNLWEADSMASMLLIGDSMYTVFEEFAKEKLTNVKDGEKYGAMLQEYYQNKLKEVKAELEAARNKSLRELEKQNKRVEQVADEYKKVLWKREKYRMEKYGCLWTNTGWMNIDVGIESKDWKFHRLEYMVENGKEVEQVYSYVLYSSIKSLYRLNSQDNSQFYAGNQDEKSMIMPVKKKAIAVAVGYKEDGAYLAIREFETITEEKIELTLLPVSVKELKQKLAELNRYYTSENLMSKDLEFMKFFAREKKRQKELQKQEAFMERLRTKAFPCRRLMGEALFTAECASCHHPFEKKVGPALIGLTARKPINWIISFTRNSDQVKATGDPYAVQLTSEYGGMAMPAFNLTDHQIVSIFEWIDGLSAEEKLSK